VKKILIAADSLNWKMNIFPFVMHFTDVKNCRLHLKAQLDMDGVIYAIVPWPKNKWSYQLSRVRILFYSGTIMESSKLSFMTCYRTIFLLSTTNKRVLQQRSPILIKAKDRPLHPRRYDTSEH